MNPFLQENWSDVHTALIGYLREALSDEMPPDLTARAEEWITVAEGDEPIRSYRADIGVVEPWRSGFPPFSFSGNAFGAAGLAVAEPLLFMETRMPERWIEIHDAGGDLITVLEILSPVDKTDAGKDAYLRRQEHFLAAGVNVVEIDLIRGGIHTVGIGRERLYMPAGTCYLICVSRLPGDGLLRREVYVCPLREPLPVIRVPLRRRDEDVVLPLQPLIDRVYRTGRHWLTDTTRPLQPPAADEAEAAWIAGRLADPSPAAGSGL